MDQAGDRGEHVLGRRRVEGRGGLVEDQHARVGGEHRPDGDALLLAAGEGAQVARAQVGDAEQVERLLDPAAHRLRSGAELLHAVGELLLDRVGDEPGERVLADVPDEVRPLARRLVDDAAPVEQDVAGEDPAGEARHQAGDDAEQRGLADAGAAGDEDQLALLEGEVDVAQHLVLVVAEADVAQLDHAVAVHAVTSRRTGAVAGTGVATAGSDAEHAEREGERRQVRDDVDAGVGDDDLRVADVPAQHRDREADADREQLGPAPRVGPVAGALHAPSGADQPERPRPRRRRRASGSARTCGARRVEPGVRPDADAGEGEEQQRAGHPALADGRAAGAAVAAGVHAGRQGQGALERVLEDRHQEAAEPSDAGGGAAAQRLGGPDPAGAVGELREDRHRDDEGRADLVERRRHGGEQALGVGQRVGGADAEDDRGEPEPVVQPGQQRLAGHRTEQPDPGRPVRQRDLGQVEEHVADLLAAEDDAGRPPACTTVNTRQQHVEPERPAEGVTGPTRHHHHRRRPHDEEQQQRVGGERCRRGQPDRPGPPGDRVQVTRQGRRSGHGASDPPSTTRHDRAARDRDREQPEHAPGDGGRHPGGLSACGSAASEDALDAESPGDSEAEPEGSSPALDGESLGDSSSSEPFADPLPDPLSDPLSPFAPAPPGLRCAVSLLETHWPSATRRASRTRTARRTSTTGWTTGSTTG